jgi:hypothetical protein
MVAMKARWGTRFGSWVRHQGPRRLAEHLGVTRKAVYGWVGGQFPSVLYQRRIMELSHGAISSDDIVAHCAKLRASHLKRRPPEGHS